MPLRQRTASIKRSPADDRALKNWTLLALLAGLPLAIACIVALAEIWGIGGTNSFDRSIVLYLNRFAHRSWALDAFVGLGTNHLVMGGVFTAMIWWAWFDSVGDKAVRRETLLCGSLAYFPAVWTCRMIAAILPFSERPLYNSTFQIHPPYGVATNTLIDWSSFPSDHASAFFTLATCIFFVSRKVGAAALFHAFLTACFVRVYMGFHYPSDVIFGALIGSVFGYVSNLEVVRELCARPILRISEKQPAIFYASFFTMSSQIAADFSPPLQIVYYVALTARHAFQLIF